MSENESGTAGTVDTELTQEVLDVFPLPEQLRAMRWQIDQCIAGLPNGDILTSWLVFDRRMGEAWIESLRQAEELARVPHPPS